MSYEAKVILDSVTKQGHRLTTMQLTFPRFILAEFNTHRLFSRNSASSRAIPVERRVAQVLADPFIPAAFGSNQRGMQAGAALDESLSAAARELWLKGATSSVEVASELAKLGVHKQWANRFIELFAWHTVVVSSTEWSNYDGLRDHPAASPEIVTITQNMKKARAESAPSQAVEGYWHLPYVYGPNGQPVDGADIDAALDYAKKNDTHWLQVLRKVSVGRCAAVSYLRQEERNFAKDVDRYHTLRASGHMSPFEHAARPMVDYEYNSLFQQKEVVWDDVNNTLMWVGIGFGHGNDPDNSDGNWLHYCGNFQGWVQERKMIPNEHDFSKLGAT